MHETASTDQVAGLHRCLNCASGLVHPVEWEPVGPDSWSVLLRCPDCEVHRAGVFEQPILDEFDRELDRGDELLRRHYVRRVRENMADEIERFAAALAAGAILPEDF
jgi:hypothetical protein